MRLCFMSPGLSNEDAANLAGANPLRGGFDFMVKEAVSPTTC
jgi:hypothetical protein